MSATPDPAADGPWRDRILRRVVTVALALIAWILADLWLGRDLLPWAPALEHLAFRSIVGPMEWLTEGSGVRLTGALAAWASLSAMGLLARKRSFGAVVWQANAVLLTGGLLFACVLGLLMERALAGGMLLAVAVRVGVGDALLIPSLRGRAGRLDPPARRLVGVLLVIGGGAALYWFYAVFMTFGEGYALLRWLGGLLRDGGVPFVAVWAGVVTVLLGVTEWVLGRTVLVGPRRPALIAGVLVGVLAVPLLRSLLGSEGLAWTGLLLVPLTLASVELLAPALILGEPQRALVPSTWPRRLLLPAALGALLVSHTYATRVFACPDEGDMPFLRKVASTTEIFRIAPGADGRLALSGREGRSIGWLDPATGEIGRFAPGPVAAEFPEGVTPDGSMAGNPEELVWSEADGAWYATIVPADPFAYMPADAPPGYEVRNVIVKVDPDTLAVVDAAGYPGMCWINTLHAQADGLWIGCEDRPGLVRVENGEVAEQWGPPELGDVQDLAFSPDGERMWSISLWFRQNLTEIRRDDLSIAAQVGIGGTHYHLAHDPVTNRLFASAWYGSRLRVVSAGALRKEGSLPLGFGGRAVTVDAKRRLVLASSTYDGLVRVCDPDTLTVRAALPVGGHVKAIALDEELGRAWFWSQCGLYELDLDGLVQWLDDDK